jgi:hypothetical protein
MDPRLAAQPNTIKQVYQVVRSNHLEEEIEAELQARTPAAEEEEDNSAWETATETEKAPTRVVPRYQGGVAPSGDASASRPVARSRQMNAPSLSREERGMAEIFGIKSADEWKKYGDPTWRPDITGFKGKSRV